MYSYDLPSDRIAIRPLPERDASKLLVFDKASGTIQHRIFRELSEILPPRSLLVVNRSRVVAARLEMLKPSGGAVEILLTQPVSPTTDPVQALASPASSTWECLIGGRNVHPGMDLSHASGRLHAHVVSRDGMEGCVALTPSVGSLAAVLEDVGHVPLPPYLRRDDDDSDRHRYQTVFAKDDGSVAAPTAGLHFTDRVLLALEEKGIERVEVTLHVGLGTFKPIDVVDIRQHIMHRERIEVTRAALVSLLDHLDGAHPYVTVVGTTSMRTLESLYWFGVRLLREPSWQPEMIECSQWSAFEETTTSPSASLRCVVKWMDERSMDRAWGFTSLLLAPGATIAVTDALVTNFHQPGNTLIMLVATMAGDPAWKQIYDEALKQQYRFLSYGDSSLIIRTPITEFEP